jgi:PPM family protein phosphatase
MKLRVHGATDLGHVRETNEDSFLVDEAHAVFAVADGIGGMPGGEVASQTAIETLQRELASDPAAAIGALDALLQRVNAAVRAAGRRFGPGGIGTTLTLAHIADGRATLAHVGDSFALLVRGGRCRALTREHNVENERTGVFELTPFPSQYRYALTRSIGQPDSLQVDVAQHELAGGDVLILATDGLTDLVDLPVIAAVCAGSRNPDEIADDLIARALRAGGNDNITVVVVCVDAA